MSGDGVVAKNGKLWFEGTADGSYFSTTHKYADFIMEFEYEVPKMSSIPATTYNNYNGLVVGVGSNSYSGWTNSVMVQFISDASVGNVIQMQDFKAGTMTQFYRSAVAPNDITYFSTQDVDLKLAVKLVVVNNNIKVYIQDITNGFDAANYILVGTDTVADTYGYISICSSESAYFSIDNLRITSVSNKDVATMEASVAAFVDMQAIADEEGPTELAAPAITLSDKTVSWTAVTNATGYVVTVNGVASEKQTATTYTLTNPTKGTPYVISVKAIGDGVDYADSVASNEVRYYEEETTPGGNDNPTNPTNPTTQTTPTTPANPTTATPATPTSNTTGTKKKGCRSALGLTATIFVASLAIVFIKRKEQE